MKFFPLILALVLTWGCTPAEFSSSNESGIQVTAEIISYEAAAEWDHFSDDSFAVRDSIKARILSPDIVAGKTIRILAEPFDIPEDSPLRNAECSFAFNVDPADLKNDQFLWGSLKNRKVNH